MDVNVHLPKDMLFQLLTDPHFFKFQPSKTWVPSLQPSWAPEMRRCLPAQSCRHRDLSREGKTRESLQAALIGASLDKVKIFGMPQMMPRKTSF